MSPEQNKSGDREKNKEEKPLSLCMSFSWGSKTYNVAKYKIQLRKNIQSWKISFA
jgi:hypothetical protein